MNRTTCLALFGGIMFGLSSVIALSDEPSKKGSPDQPTKENKQSRKERFLTLIVTPPGGWFSKRFEVPGEGEILSIFQTDDQSLTDGFGIFRHGGFNAAPYTPEGILAVNIQQSFIPGGLPYRTKDIAVGVEKRDAKWLGYTQNGKTTDLVFVKHEYNVYRLSGTYSKDDKAMRDLFWEMVKSAEFVSKPSK